MGWEPHPTGVVRKGQSGSSAAYKSSAGEQLGRAEGVVVVVVVMVIPKVHLPAWVQPRALAGAGVYFPGKREGDTTRRAFGGVPSA